jgi:hypothetical protein
MKKIYILIICACTLLSLGCKKGLEPRLYGRLTPATFPQTETEYELYILEVYKPFQAKWAYNDGTQQQFMFHGYEYSNIMLNDYPTDLIAVFPEWGGFFEFYSKADFKFMINQSRTSHFEKVRFVTRITQIIADLEKSNLNNDKKNQLIAEAKMARGWLMYYLLTMYGPVPVITDPAKIGTEAEFNMTRPERSTYVSTITQDLRFAADNLPKTAAQYGRFNKGLALTVLMRAYLNEKDWQKAEQTGRELLTIGYSLIDNYRDLFRSATEKNNETIYAISVDPAANGQGNQGNMNAWSYYTYPSDFKGITQNGGWASPSGAFTATWEFYDSFLPLDERRELLITEYTSRSGQVKNRSNMRGPVIMKYPDEDNTAFAQGNDIPLARYADVLLMLAEAINQQSGPTSEAIEFVNMVRRRANIGNLPAADVASKQAFNDAILRERSWELFFEGQRRVDLIRHDKWASALQSVGKTPGPALFPVPRYALDASKGTLTQTQGY